MAEKDESSLIGYDPLAWLHRQAEERPISPLPLEYADAEPQAWNAGEQTETSSEPETESADWQDTTFETQEEPASALAAIVLDPVLSIQNVAQLHERLLGALDSSIKIEIDASAVTMVDTATLQLLLILKRTAIKQQKQVAIDFPSDRFIEAADLLGISEMLEVDRAAAGFF